MTSTDIYATNIQLETLNNSYYRRVLFTTREMQLVVQKLYPGESISREIHPNITQFIRVEEGKALVEIDDGISIKHSILLEDDEIIMIPSGTYHSIYAVSNEPLSLYTIYSPPEHPPNTLQLNPPKE